MVMTGSEPKNEAETIALFKLAEPVLGWHIVHLQTAFPDAIIESADGQRLVAEFEYLAANFKAHGHDPSGCNLVICWRDNWPGASLPVWALESCPALALAVQWAAERVRGASLEIGLLEAELASVKRRISLLRLSLTRGMGKASLSIPLFADHNPLMMLNDKAFGEVVATVYVRLAARLDAQLEDFFGE